MRRPRTTRYGSLHPRRRSSERSIKRSKQSSNLSGLAALEASSFPAPATGAAFPPIEAADTQSPSMYAMAFTQELLDVDFATTTRNELLAWAGYNNAPNTTIDIPTSAAAEGAPRLAHDESGGAAFDGPVVSVGEVAHALARQRSRDLGESHVDPGPERGLGSR
jgi:hypothetical protein